MTVAELILVVDAVAERLPPLVEALRASHRQVVGLTDADRALGQAALDEPSIVIVRNLSDGWPMGAYCKALRRLLPPGKTTLVAAPTTETGMATDFEDWVDLVLPSDLPPQMLARRAISFAEQHLAPDSCIIHGGLCLDINRMQLSGFGSSAFLNGQMLEIMKLLMQEPGRVYSRDEILAALGKNGQLSARSVDVYVRRLRNTIKQAGMPDLLETVRAHGYRMI
jgi:DNA-binding response OmpR family regulator